MALDLSRRTLLRGVMNGSAVAVGLPLLDIFLDSNGEALASGAPMPVRFGTWFWGLGCNPSRWFPSQGGANYELKPELAPIKDYQSKINIIGNFAVLLDGAANLPHQSGGAAIRTGKALTADRGLPGESFDVTIGDQIGTRTRFRSLDLSAIGDARNSLSGRGGGNLNPSEVSVTAFYARVFGDGFKDPNSATFVPDAKVMARRSVLSAVAEDRQALGRQLGAADQQKLDQYFTSVRQLEKQLDVELTKPEPLQACSVPAGGQKELTVTGDVDTVAKKHQMMADLLVMALACDQTRVFNMMFNNGASNLTRVGSTITHHQLTHEEILDTRLGYQPQATFFLQKIMAAWAYFVGALDGVKEGNGTLLDNTLVFAHSETGFAKFHTIDNIPMMTAGSGGGRFKTGLFIDGQASPISRVGLTLQTGMGVSLDKWGSKSMETNKTLTDMLV